MGKSKPKTPSERIFQILGVVIPIATFVLGYGLSSWDRYTDKQDRIDNMRYIYGVELAQNLELLVKVQPPENYDRPVPPHLVSLIANSLSLKIYNAYLSQLADLTSKESKAVFNAYRSIQDLQAQAREFLGTKPPPSGDRSIWAARATAVLSVSEKAHQELLDAVSILPVTDDKLTTIHNAYGEAIRNYDSIQVGLDSESNQN